MANIIKGTTPTITYTFSTVQPSDIAAAYLTIIQDGAELLEKDMTSATVGESSLSWTLTQSETLAMSGSVSAMLNFRLADGTRGASTKTTFMIESNYKDEVI